MEEKSEGMENTREHGQLNQQIRAHMGSQRLTWQVSGLHASTPGPLHMCYGCYLGVFVGHTNSESKCVSNSLACF